MNKPQIAQLMNVNEGTLSQFDNVFDVFNPGNSISGFLCVQSDHNYGALAICEVNGEECSPQIIYGTPKLHYPFGRTNNDERSYHWPKNIERVEVANKWDGTNINCFSYTDTNGNRFVTFKTRLTPVIKDGNYGSFVSMWNRMLEKYPQLKNPSCVLSGEYSLSFELYGYQNQHLIVYDVPLDAQLLFGVRQADAKVFPPQYFANEIPNVLPMEFSFSNANELTSQYEKWREEADNQNKKILNDSNETEAIEGTEGYIFYVLSSGEWSQWKCKPPSVEALHWVSDYIPESIIYPTAMNALESCDELTADYVSTLLREEFTEKQVLSSYSRIEKVVHRIIGEQQFNSHVLGIYRTSNLSIAVDGKANVMRHLSKFFDKKMMKKVYRALVKLNIVEN